jgi:hypothetical protein
MNHIRCICRSLAGRLRRAGLLIASAAPGVLVADPPLPPGRNWVSRITDQTVRRPWCLSCGQGLDQSRYHLIPFDGHDGAGRSR